MLEAAIFDLDGLLIDSEPAWRRAEIETFAGVGLRLDESDCRQTMGLRVDEVVAFWLARSPWDVSRWPPDVVTERILLRVESLVERTGAALPGAVAAVAAARASGLRLAVASSSPPPVIAAALRRLALGDAFEVVRSAVEEARGKPDPAVYLTTARLLDVAVGRCVALEDSPAGVAAAKDAGMYCIAVPDPSHLDDAVVGRADVVLASLVDLDATIWERAGAH